MVEEEKFTAQQIEHGQVQELNADELLLQSLGYKQVNIPVSTLDICVFFFFFFFLLIQLL
jgi:hypothetical protein